MAVTKSAEKRVSAKPRASRAALPSGPAKASFRGGHGAPLWAAVDGRMMLLAGVVGVLVFAALVSTSRPADNRQTAQLSEPAISNDVLLPEAEPVSAPVERQAPARPSAPAPVLRTVSYSYTPTAAPVVETKSVSVEPVVEREPVREPIAETKAGLQPEPAETQAVAATIAGCLAQDAGRFVLKNVSGDDAPKTRSWKSGFLRKRSQTVELIDQAGTKRLAPYVGQRIETTGVLEEREMRVKSLRVQGACD